MYEIRKIQLSDIEKGYLELLDQLSKTNLTRRQGTMILNDIINDPNIDIFVIEHDNKIVACVTSLYEQKLIHGGKSVCHCEDLVVDEKYRGRGLSVKILKHQNIEAKKQGCYKVISTCKDVVLSTHKQLGGQIIDETPIRYNL